MATKKLNNGNGNVATSKKFSYEEMLAKALGTTPDKVKKVSDLTKGVDELFKETMAKLNSQPDGGLTLSEADKREKEKSKRNGKTSQEIMAEVDAEILESENADEAEEIEIVEVVPVVGKKKVIAQNSAQAQKLIATKAQESKPEMTEEEKKSARRKEISAKALEAKRAKKLAQESPAPAPVSNKKSTATAPSTPLSKMTVAQLKEMKGKISDVQLNKYLKMASKRDGVQLTQVAPELPKSITRHNKSIEISNATITRTRTNKPESKPADAVSDLINKGKENEARAILNKLLVAHKGMTLEKIEESAGKLNAKMVNELISKMKDAPTPVSNKPKASTSTTTTPLSKMTLAQIVKVRGTISDVQWMKYYKMACKKENVTPAPVSKLESKPDEATLLTRRFGVSKAQAEKIVSAPESKPTVTRTRKITTASEPEKEIPNAQAILELAVELYEKLGTFINAFDGLVK